MYDWAAVELGRWMKLRGLTHREVAETIHKDRTLVTKILRGESPLQQDHAELLDAAWNTGGLFGRIIRLAKSRHRSEWGAEQRAVEAEASQIFIWSLGWVPVLAQTEEYARAGLTEAGRLDADQAVKARMDQQKLVLDRTQPPLLWLLIDQDALEHRVGTVEVHRAQLARLLELSALSNWTVRAVSRTAGGHVGRDGSFLIYRVGAEDIPYTETLGPGRLIRDASEMLQYPVWFRRIGDVAESKRESVALIRQIMEEIHD
jgi:transcriptional regulator with XRE-family HTH domain